MSCLELQHQTMTIVGYIEEAVPSERGMTASKKALIPLDWPVRKA